MADKNILLIEPSYKNKYPPVGLMKIAQYHGPHGKSDNIRFVKGEDNSALEVAWDRIYVTTLFTFEWKKIERSINFALEAANGQSDKVFVGGIAASLLHEEFLKEKKWRGIRFIKGLLTGPAPTALQLDSFTEELYSDDIYGPVIEDLIPDYSILDQIEYKYPVHDAYFVYASRGCIRKCKFCGVPKLEGAQRDTDSISAVVYGVEALFGTKKDLMLMDNNVVASPRYKEIIAEIRDLGFERGATLKRGRVDVQRRVDFNQGIDARILCKDPMYLREMSTIAIKPLRIAFDHIGVRKPYDMSIRYAADAGLTDLSNYMLYNFHDTPEDLYQRMHLNIELNEELNIRIYSFPMRYQPVNLKDRSHIGKNWNKYYLRSMQIILQATHGIVSGAPQFFRRAFGDTPEEYKELLMQPHHYTFNREWFEKLDGRARWEEYKVEMRKLSGIEKEELLEIISGHNKGQFKKAQKAIKNKKIKNIMEHYIPLGIKKEREIWDKQKEYKKTKKEVDIEIPEDERVEDAGIEVAA